MVYSNATCERRWSLYLKLSEVNEQCDYLNACTVIASKDTIVCNKIALHRAAPLNIFTI